ncbi:hypothetical protein ILYODFUR_011234 [Ilyodon furcidens]|uniref:Uncharacterized protein n=1 Tax=Ilyodon furcidens TaxID=33524 RepID=A0ABV0THQ7_9TELE
MPPRHNTFIISMPLGLESSLSCLHKLIHLPQCLRGMICHSHAFSSSFIILTALHPGRLPIFFHSSPDSFHPHVLERHAPSLLFLSNSSLYQACPALSFPFFL